ncbi:MAG TPA: MBL fold metallo-hydrolase [Gammaproteobacteria bacterium]|nr:MBL fold metallo-hydrolase [Gammaproteobacteria bacterium]
MQRKLRSSSLSAAARAALASLASLTSLAAAAPIALALIPLAPIALAPTAASAQRAGEPGQRAEQAVDTQPARALLDAAAAAMGGRDRLERLDNFVMTGFGQRYASNGNISADPNSPPKWQAIAEAERYFDLRNGRALSRERAPNMFPFAAPFGMSLDPRERLQTGVAVLDHPLPALLAALAPSTKLGPVEIEDGMAVVPFTTADGTTLRIALDPTTQLPYWTRWITGNATLGDVTNTAYFTGYLPVDGVWLPTGLMQKIDWRNQTTLMFQVDSYRLDVDDMPKFPAAGGAGSGGAGEGAAGGPPQVQTTQIADGVWDVRIAGGGSGGAVVEFADHLVMFEPYGNEAQTFARIDAANRLVPGKQVTAVIVGHHHEDHAGGLRAAVSRGLTIIAQRRTRPLFEEWVRRPAVHFPDALARNPRPMDFVPVDEHLVLQDSTRRLDVYHAVGDFHMSDALIAYLPNEKIIMEGDFTDDTWTWNWWGYALRANMELYGLDPKIDIPVHGTPGTIEEKLARTNEQVEAAQRFCAESAARGSFPFGCPVRYSTTGAIAE